MGKLVKANFLPHVHGLPLSKLGFKRSALDMGMIRVFYSSVVGGFQMEDLAG